MAHTKNQSVKNKSVSRKGRAPAQKGRISIVKESVKLARHHQTGKLIHHSHTSHAFLFLFVILVGIMIFALSNAAGAQTVSIDHSTTVVATVAGPPPSIGATILSPVEGDIINEQSTKVTGTCQPSTVVVIYDNGVSVGSVACTSASVFSLTIPLTIGENALQALNYDGLDQPGPATPTVTVSVPAPIEQPEPAVPGTDGTPVPITPTVATPIVDTTQLLSPFILPVGTTQGTTTCQDIDGTASQDATTQLQVRVTCSPRYLQPNSSYDLKMLIHGGVGPYAVSIDWGDGTQSNGLFSQADQGVLTTSMRYTKPGSYLVKITVTDSRGVSSFTTVQVYVNGTTASSVFASIKNDFVNKSWFETPVPIYTSVVVLTAGFWIGDIFNKLYGARAYIHTHKLGKLRK